jgi:carbon-monoxide dehydrogenase small subunit
MKLKFMVNQKSVELHVDPQKRLLDVLREDLFLIGTKEGCAKGECGSCTVFLNGRRINSCLVPAFQLNDSKIMTIEGLREYPVFKTIEKSFVEEGAVQCGYCIPGFIMSTAGFLNESQPPYDEDQIKYGVAGNICRCTGYTKILDAIQSLQSEAELLVELHEIIEK